MTFDGIRGSVDQDWKRGMDDRGWRRWLRTRRARRVLAAVTATMCLAILVAAGLVGSGQGARSMGVGVVGAVTLGWVGLLMGRSPPKAWWPSPSRARPRPLRCWSRRPSGLGTKP